MNQYLVMLGNTQVARFNSIKHAYEYLEAIPVSDWTAFDYRVVQA